MNVILDVIDAGVPAEGNGTTGIVIAVVVVLAVLVAVGAFCIVKASKKKKDE